MFQLKIKKSFAKFSKDCSGATAIIYALCLFPILGIAGFAIDASRLQSAKATTAAAMDAAVMATVQEKILQKSLGKNMKDSELKTYATEFLKLGLANLHTDVDCSNVQVKTNAGSNKIKLSADCGLPTTLGAILGVDKFEYTNAAAAEQSFAGLELSMVLDYSKSMDNNNKIEDLKVAAKDALDILLANNTNKKTRVGLVPYSRGVNVGVSRYSEMTGESLDTDDTACVTERDDLFKAFTDDPATLGKFTSKVNNCPNNDNPIIPLTDDLNELKAAIDKAVPNGGTAGHIGAAWGWYLLAEPWQTHWTGDSQPQDYDKPSLIKAVIIMTDGQFKDADFEADLGRSHEQALKICENMRYKGVIVYTVGFDIDVDDKLYPGEAVTTGDVLIDCAGDPSRFFNAADANELTAAYQTIASRLTQLRLSE